MENQGPSEWTKEVQSWTANHFSITDGDGNTAALLTRVAAALQQLGNIEVLDITYSLQPGSPNDECTMTVYFNKKD